MNKQVFEESYNTRMAQVTGILDKQAKTGYLAPQPAVLPLYKKAEEVKPKGVIAQVVS